METPSQQQTPTIPYSNRSHYVVSEVAGGFDADHNCELSTYVYGFAIDPQFYTVRTWQGIK